MSSQRLSLSPVVQPTGNLSRSLASDIQPGGLHATYLRFPSPFHPSLLSFPPHFFLKCPLIPFRLFSLPPSPLPAAGRQMRPYYMSATSHNAPQTKSCALVLGASSKDLHVSEKLWMNNACEGVGFRSCKAGGEGGLRFPERINPSRIGIVARLREETLTPRLEPVILVGRFLLAHRDASTPPPYRAPPGFYPVQDLVAFHCPGSSRWN